MGEGFFIIECDSELPECRDDEFCLILLSSPCDDTDRGALLADIRESEYKSREAPDIIVVAQSGSTGVLRDDDRGSTKVFTCWGIEIGSSGTLDPDTLIAEVIDIDPVRVDILESDRELTDLSEGHAGVEMRDDSGIDLTDPRWIRKNPKRKCLFFESLQEELLTLRSIKVTSGMSRTCILECSSSIELLRTSSYTKNLISPVIVWILSIDNILWYIDMDTTECIYDILESTEVDHDITIDSLSSDLGDLFSEELDANLVRYSYAIESIDLACCTISLRIRYKKISRNRYESYIATITIDTREHDRVCEE